MLMTPEEALEFLRPWLARFVRPAWLPVVADEDNGPVDSKFSGLPLLPRGEAWPKCRVCDLPLELFLQLDLSQLPAELDNLFGVGILQLFYCRGDNCEPGWEPFSNQCSLCRVIEITDAIPAESMHGTFPPRSIIGWDRIIDSPDPVELGRLGLIVDYHFSDVPFRPAEIICPELDFRYELKRLAPSIEELTSSTEGDKLAGWPHWVQGVEYPACTRCGSEMRLLMQLDSEDNIPYMFGDAGIGHITQCPTHKDVVAFGWACC